MPASRAEEVGFEPTVLLHTHDFQSCPLGLYGTPPGLITTGTSARPRVERDVPMIIGGESGIRTHGACDSTLHFEGSSLNRSDISPSPSIAHAHSNRKGNFRPARQPASHVRPR